MNIVTLIIKKVKKIATRPTSDQIILLFARALFALFPLADAHCMTDHVSVIRHNTTPNSKEYRNPKRYTIY
jgi:hypothetical protein